MNVIWFLLILAPNEAAGRQVGPFVDHSSCLVAKNIYNEQISRYTNRLQSECVKGTR